MDSARYELRGDLALTKYLTDIDTYIYLTDKEGNQLAKVVLCDEGDLSSIVEKGGKDECSE